MIAYVGVDDGKAALAVGVTDDLKGKVSAVDLLKAGVAAVGGQGGGGRPDMAQGGGPDGAKANEALEAIAALKARWRVNAGAPRYGRGERERCEGVALLTSVASLTDSSP